MSHLDFKDRVKASLTGAVIGAELAYARVIAPEKFDAITPDDIFDVKLEPLGKSAPPNMWHAGTVPFIDLGVQAYLTKQGRVTPEDFADIFQTHPATAIPAFTWDPIHTTREILKEGMNPRISGMGNVPCGIISAGMPAVGIYHFAQPEYAYLDGVELASVTQPRLGADWAGLCAAAISAAFDPSATAGGIVETVLRIAFENNRDLFYELDFPLKWGGPAQDGEQMFRNLWFHDGGARGIPNTKGYTAFNPIGHVLTLLRVYGDDFRKLMAMLVAPKQERALVSAVIGGAILGALHGMDSIPVEWREWAEPVAQPWCSITEVVDKRLAKEREIVTVVKQIAKPCEDGESVLFDKVYGCILAGAIGNAMGSPAEGKSYQEIDKLYPGGITTILNTSALETEDDNQQAMMMVETYLERDGRPIMARHFGQTWMKRMNRDMFFVNCMGHCYDLIKSGWDARITGHWTQVTGSTVMCMEPVGIYNLADPDYANIDATAVSYMYQRGLDVVAASLLSSVVAEAFRPGATVDSICRTAVDFAPTTKLRTFDERSFYSAHDFLEKCMEIADKYDDVLAARAELYEKCLFYHCIDPLELFGLALAMFKIARGDVRQAAIGGTNIGRDSDTIAGRSAMLAGLHSGYKSVPEDWVALFRPAVLEKIRRNSQRLVDLLIAKNEQMKSRAALLA